MMYVFIVDYKLQHTVNLLLITDTYLIYYNIKEFVVLKYKYINNNGNTLSLCLYTIYYD